MDFKPSKEYLALLRDFEGFFEEPYLCPAGCATIGYGTNLEAHRGFIPWGDLRSGGLKGKALVNALKARGLRWTTSQADDAMTEELTGTHNQLKRQCEAYRVLLGKNETCRAEALLDMAYNMGVTGLLGFYATLPLIERGDYEAACGNLAQSKWYRQVGRRARTVCAMLKTNQYPERVL